jgi:cell wall-associated NlpC family hydrolase
MKPWFDTDARRQALLTEAESWVGTPFFGNSSAKGRGVSCQKLAGALYEAVGFGSLNVPDAPMSRAQFCDDSLVVAWMQDRTDFVPVSRDGPLLAGDLVTFRLPRSIHHVGVMVLPGVFISATEDAGAQFRPLADSTWRARLAYVWTPVQP